MTNFGEIVNVDTHLVALRKQINQLENIKYKRGFNYAILYPIRISPISSLKVPQYAPAYREVKLLYRACAYYKDSWSVRPVIVKLEMCKEPVFISGAGGWLKKVIIRFIASDNTYIYIKTIECKKWLRVGELVNKGGNQK